MLRAAMGTHRALQGAFRGVRAAASSLSSLTPTVTRSSPTAELFGCQESPTSKYWEGSDPEWTYYCFLTPAEVRMGREKGPGTDQYTAFPITSGSKRDWKALSRDYKNAFSKEQLSEIRKEWANYVRVRRGSESDKVVLDARKERERVLGKWDSLPRVSVKEDLLKEWGGCSSATSETLKNTWKDLLLSDVDIRGISTWEGTPNLSVSAHGHLTVMEWGEEAKVLASTVCQPSTLIAEAPPSSEGSEAPTNLLEAAEAQGSLFVGSGDENVWSPHASAPHHMGVGTWLFFNSVRFVKWNRGLSAHFPKVDHPLVLAEYFVVPDTPDKVRGAVLFDPVPGLQQSRLVRIGTLA